jgi:hypothetical protein
MKIWVIKQPYIDFVIYSQCNHTIYLNLIQTYQGMKKIILSAALLLILNNAFSQTFMHGAGITLIGSTTGQGSNSDIGLGEGFTYFPRINFVETEKLSVSVGVPLCVGISATTSYDPYGYGSGNSNEIGFILNAPLIINLNIGRGSTKENTKRYGYFVGAGFGFHHDNFLTSNRYDPVTNSYIDSYTSNSYGPAANAGFRIGVGQKHKNIEIRLSYMKGINESRPNVMGLAAAFNF